MSTDNTVTALTLWHDATYNLIVAMRRHLRESDESFRAIAAQLTDLGELVQDSPTLSVLEALEARVLELEYAQGRARPTGAAAGA